MTTKCRLQLLDELQTSQQGVCHLLEAMAHAQDWQREPAEWSFRFLAAHLVTVERECYFPRVVRIAAGERPYFGGYIRTDLNLGGHDLSESLAEWVRVRRQLIDYVAALPDDCLNLTGIHADLGYMTVLDTLDEIVAQDYGMARHIRQLMVDYHESLLHPVN
jgi:hypothetical protein